MRILLIVKQFKYLAKFANSLAVLLIIIPCSGLFSQSFKISLSENHQAKLSKIESGHKRLLKFYNFYKKDSAHHVKGQERHYKKVLDSTWRAERKQQRLEKRMIKKGILTNKELTMAESLSKDFKIWWGLLKDSTISDSVKTIAKGKVKEIALERARQYPGFQHYMDKYQLSGDSVNWKELSKQVPGLDTLSGIFDSDPKRLFALAEEQSMQQLQRMGNLGSLNSQFAEAEKLKSFPDEYKKQYEQYTDKDRLKEEGKQKAVQHATDYFATHASSLQGAQAKVSSLMSKYKDFSNSNDLSSAVKRTSLEGKSFKERLVIGGNFNIVSTAPVSLDFSPQIGYKFNTRFSAGIGVNYRYTFSDSIRSSSYVSPKNTAIKAFANYNVIKDFFVYGEWQRAGLKSMKNDQAPKTWVNNYFVGLGRKFLVHPKLYLTLTALYNLNGQDNNPSYPKRFQIRIGFQTSELAFRKKKVLYDPNR